MKHYCSFCLRSEDDVAKLIAAPHGCICDDCVADCSSIIAQEAQLAEIRQLGT